MSKFAYLIKVDKDENNNKFYRMIDLKDGTFNSEYGRVGANHQTRNYPISKWNSTYRSKIKKGYEDHTKFVAEKTIKESTKYLEIPNKMILEIVNKLQGFAKKAIEQNYTITSNNVTQEMIDEATLKLNELIMCPQDLDMFNNILIELFKIIPRKMKSVNGALLKDLKYAQKLIEGEQDLLDVMRGQVVQNAIENKDINIVNKTILEAMGIEIIEATEEEKLLVKRELGEIRDKYSNCWKVLNKKTQKNFDIFTKSNNIKENKLLWHGTRSENVWSILCGGLSLRPNAKITGKMFGHGIYFAPKAKKSLGYTSLSGSYWAKGGSKSGYMMLFETAYGNPYNVYSFNSKYYNFNHQKLQNAESNTHCLHAHSGKMLKNDEIIYYKEEQMTIKYLVELK